MSTNYIAPIWRMPENANNTPVNKLSNYSMDFDAGTSSQAIECGKGSNVDITGPISISVWFNSTATDGARGIVCKNESQASQNFAQYFFDQLSGELRWRAGKTTVTHAINADQWYHAVGVYDGSNVSLYIDGTQVATAAASASSYQSNEPMYIGRRLGQNYFGGKIAQVCIFDYALSTPQVGYLYLLNSPMVPGTENLIAPVAYWPLGDNSNPNADAGYPNISTGADSVFELPEGNSYPNSLVLADALKSAQKITFAFWFNTTSTTPAGPTGYTLAIRGTISSVGGCFALMVRNLSGKKFQCWFYDGSGTSPNPILGHDTDFTDYNDGKWHHMAVTIDGTLPQTALKMYLDGVLASSATSPNTGINIPTGNDSGNVPKADIILGQRKATYSALGAKYSNFSTFDDVLDDTAILSLYNDGVPTNVSSYNNLTGWWKLNQSANWEADTAGEWQIPDAVSSYPQSFSFDGIDDKINLIKPGDWDDSQVHCVSLWVKNEDAGVGYVVNSRGGGSFDPGFSFITRSSDSTGYIFSNTLTSKIGTSYQSDLYIPIDGKWHHVLWTHDPTTHVLKAYIDGIYKYTFTGNAGTDNVPSIGPIIGKSGGAPWKGKVSNIMAWEQIILTDGNVAIGESAEDQVAEVYNNGVPLESASVATSNLKLWAKLDNTEIFNKNSNTWNIFNNRYSVPTPTYTQALRKAGSGYNYALGLISSGNVNNISITDEITSSIWLKTTTTTNQGVASGIIGCGPLVYYGPSNGSRFLLIRGPSNYKYVVAPNFNDGNWHNIIIYSPGYTQSDINNVRFWFDGKEIISGALSSGVPTYDTATLAVLGASNYLNAYAVIDASNAVVWNSDQTLYIDEIYNNGVPATSYTNDPKLWWTLTDTSTSSGGGHHDKSGNNNNSEVITSPPTTIYENVIAREYGTSTDMEGQSLVNNNVSTLNGEGLGLNTTNLIQSNLTRKKPYSSYSMNLDSADNDYIRVPNPGSKLFAYGESAFTFSGWISIDAYTDQDGIFSRFYSGAERATIKLNFNSPFNGLMFQAVKNNANAYLVWDGILPDPANGEWKHICLTYDAGNVKLYLDGVDQGAGTATGTMPTTMPDLTSLNPQIEIGRDSMSAAQRVLNGRVSNFCVLDRALSESEALKIYNNGITQNLQKTSSFSNNILAWWPMDENSSYYDGSDWVVRDIEGGKDGLGINTGNVEDMVGSAPGSESNGVGSNLTIEYLKGDMSNSNKNAYSINMADYADSVINPANSGRSTEVPSV